MLGRTGWLVAMALASFVGCTEYVGPPASPNYWKPPPPDPNPPQSLIPGDPDPDGRRTGRWSVGRWARELRFSRDR